MGQKRACNDKRRTLTARYGDNTLSGCKAHTTHTCVVHRPGSGIHCMRFTVLRVPSKRPSISLECILRPGWYSRAKSTGRTQTLRLLFIVDTHLRPRQTASHSSFVPLSRHLDLLCARAQALPAAEPSRLQPACAHLRGAACCSNDDATCWAARVLESAHGLRRPQGDDGKAPWME